MKRKILIIYVSAGAGHRSAAFALEQAFKATVADIDVKTIDALDYTNKTYKSAYVSTYLNLVKSIPEFWGYIYRSYDTQKVSSEVEKLRKVVDTLNAKKLMKFVRNYKADVIIGTHFLPLQIISHLKAKRKISSLLTGVVTDFGAHSLWMQDNIDLYFVPTEEVKRELNRFGQPISKISITGIPVDMRFGQKQDKNMIRKKLGITENSPTLLLLAGGYGVGPVEKFITAFKNINMPIQFLVVCGKNEKLVEKIKSISKGLSIKIFGFVDNVHELMEVSDIVATKPGGLTSSEVLAKGKPMIVLDPIPGQEQRNGDYLLEQGVAVRLSDPADAPYKVEELLKNEQKIKNMEQNAKAIAKPMASKNIVDEIMSYLSGRDEIK